jgi:hypothetical protein
VLALGLVLIGGAGASLGAQQGVVRGTVTDSSGVPIPDVELLLHDINIVTRADSGGRFAFPRQRPAAYLITARRLGFSAVTWSFTLRDSVVLALVMYRSQQTLPRVTINGEQRYTPAKLLDFYDRLRTSGAPRSSFVTREEIERLNPYRSSDIVRSRGGRASTCLRGMIYVDGARMPPGSSFDPPAGKRRTVPDTRSAMDIIPPGEIQAMEIYRSSATIPSQYNGTAPGGSPPGCVILIWTR